MSLFKEKKNMTISLYKENKFILFYSLEGSTHDHLAQ